MKQIVPFTKNISFDTNVDEVTSISLDKRDLETKDNNISGVFDLYLEYKENDVSVDTLKYNTSIPFDINIGDRYILDNVKVDIDDFYYDIDGNDVVLHIDVLVDNLEEDDRVIEEKVPIHVEEVIDKIDDREVFEEENEIIEDVTFPIYETFDPKSETYVTYNVHIVREDDTIDSICNKYGVTKEDLSNYNDISTIKMGDKLVVPTYKK